MAEKPYKPLLRNLPEYYGSAALSDGVVRFDDHNFKVHKIILSMQSKFFEKAFSERWVKEPKDSTIILKDDEAYAVDAMLQFMYMFDYDHSTDATEIIPEMLFHLRVYIVADKYSVLALKSFAKDKFEQSVKEGWNLDEFPDAIAEIYSDALPTDRGLRDIVVARTCQNIKELMQKQRFCDVLDIAVGFSSDIIKVLATRPSSKIEKIYRCPECGKQWGLVGTLDGYYNCPSCREVRSDWDKYVVK